MLLHVSRGVRWDSDHVVILTDELRAIAQETGPRRLPRPGAHRAGLLRRQHQSRGGLGDRHAGHAQGPAAALLEPTAKLRAIGEDGDFTSRLAMLEEVEDPALPAPYGSTTA